jgi:hypothetical protein
MKAENYLRLKSYRYEKINHAHSHRIPVQFFFGLQPAADAGAGMEP